MIQLTGTEVEVLSRSNRHRKLWDVTINLKLMKPEVFIFI